MVLFWTVGKTVQNSAEIWSRNAKGSAGKPSFWENLGAKLEFLSTCNLLRQKFAATCWNSIKNFHR